MNHAKTGEKAKKVKNVKNQSTNRWKDGMALEA